MTQGIIIEKLPVSARQEIPFFFIEPMSTLSCSQDCDTDRCTEWN